MGAEGFAAYLAARIENRDVPALKHPIHLPDEDEGRLFKSRELGQLCSQALANGPKSTSELAEYVIEAKGWTPQTSISAPALRCRVVNTMAHA